MASAKSTSQMTLEVGDTCTHTIYKELSTLFNSITIMPIIFCIFIIFHSFNHLIFIFIHITHHILVIIFIRRDEST